MIIRFKINKKIKSYAFSLICLFVFLFQSNSQILNALPMENPPNLIVIEELRLKVPAQYKEVWLQTEKKIWEPWLSSQAGFLGRQLFWNKEKEEALILVSWESKKLWKSIPMSEVNVIQEQFENNVKTSLKVEENPFELIYEGELDKQG